MKQNKIENKCSDVEVLLSTMHQKDIDILNKMKVKTNATVVNQDNKTELKKYEYNSNNIKMYTVEDRGIGISRNFCLQHATSKYVIFADDDIEYVDDYDKIIEKYFKKYPEADGFVFNIETYDNSEAKNAYNKKVKKLNKYNCSRYGAIKLAFKLSSLRKANVSFSLIFGAATYSSGEDTMFLQDCIKKKLRIYAVPDIICKLIDSRPSTYFKGFDEKFFYDKGAFLKANYSYIYHLLILLYTIKFKNKSKLEPKRIYNLMYEGANNYNDLIPYKK